MKKLTGRATITRDGNVILSKPGWKLSLDGFTREPQMGPNGPNGYTETPVAAYVEGPADVSDDVDLRALANDTDVAITFAADAGGTWVLPHAVQMNQIDVTAQNGGQLQLKYVSDQAQKVG